MKNEPDITSFRIANEPFFNEVEFILKTGKTVRINVCGESMYPFLRNGDQVILTSSDVCDVCKDSIVLAHTSWGWVLHRVLRVTGAKLLLAGDANARQVESVTSHEIVGVVTGIWRGDLPIPLHSYAARMTVRLWRWLRPVRGILLRIWHVQYVFLRRE